MMTECEDKGKRLAASEVQKDRQLISSCLSAKLILKLIEIQLTNGKIFGVYLNSFQLQKYYLLAA
jgi:hypothetical protein